MQKLLLTFALLISFQVTAAQDYELIQERTLKEGRATTSVTLDSKSIFIDLESPEGRCCSFEGIQTEVNKSDIENEVIFVPTNLELGYGENCRITVSFLNDEAINIEDNGQCAGFCALDTDFNLNNIQSIK